ncbi:tetratricopeptide repeat protein [soil metagenome]
MAEEKETFFRQNSELIVLTVLVIFIYGQTVGFGFINFDDNQYVYENPFVINGLNWIGIKWAFTQFHSANWHPITWISHQLDATLFGLNAGAHHATNVVFHLINSILAFVVFHKYTKCFWKSAVLAALFAAHPMHVESVAWISERKDLLSTMFWFLTMWSYFLFVEKGKDRNYYLLTVLLFVLGLMSKPMLVTLPFVLLLLDYWSLQRFESLKELKSLIIEKIPFFALSAISSYITILAQRSGGAIQTLEFLPFQTRFLNAVVSYTNYIISIFYPVNLSVWYPYNENFSFWQVALSIFLLVSITVFCFWQISKRKYLIVGWLWFLGTLVPVIGLVQVGAQPMADRYTYIPFFGLFIMLVWGLSDLFAFLNLNKKNILIFAGMVLAIFSLLSFRQTSLWKNDETLYAHSLSVTTGNYLVLQNYCHFLILKDRLDEAENFCRQSIEAKPTYAEAINTLGIIQFKRGQYTEAAESFRKTLEIKPGYREIYFNYSNALALSGNPSESEDQLKKAIVFVSPNENPRIWIESLNNLAYAYGQSEKFENAAENYARILQIAPERADIRANYALMLYKIKNFDKAQNQIEYSIRQNPDLPDSYNNYGLILLEKNEKAKAAEQFEKALKLKSDFQQAKENLKKARGDK